MINLPKAVVFIRFYGRFLFVMPKDGSPGLTALAVDLGATEAGGSGSDPTRRHQPYLTIRQEDIATGSAAPDRRFISTDVIPFRGALNLWNLEGYDIDIPIPQSKPFPIDKIHDPIHLADLQTDLHGGELNKDYLKSPRSPVTAIIRVNAGPGVELQVPSRIPKHLIQSYEYVPADHPEENGTDAGELADAVQIAIEYPSTGVTLALTKAGHERNVTVAGPQTWQVDDALKLPGGDCFLAAKISA